MDQINLKDALKLYDLLKEHIPNDTKDDTLLDFAGKIIDSIINKSKHGIYIDALMIMTKKSQEEILQLQSQEAVKMFMDGIVENDILSLKSFCEELYYARS